MMELVNELYVFSEQTVTGGPSRRVEEDVERAGRIERVQAICVVREAVEALIRVLAPFAPHTAEELWAMMGHGEGLAGATWPAYSAEVAQADEVVIPVQVNGKVRARLTVLGWRLGGRARDARACRPRCSVAYCGEEGDEGGRRRRTAGFNRGAVVPNRSCACQIVVVLALALSASGCGYALAGRGSFLSADIKVVGIPQLLNQSTFFDVEQVVTEKVRAEFIGRGKYRVIPDVTGADAVLSGTVTSISVIPIGFTEQQLASRYLFTMTMRVVFTDARTSRILWSNDALTFREEYELATRGTTAIEGSAFLSQERSSFDRIAGDVARTVVTAILEAF